ncbi:MAG: hypothetical protein MR019_03230 [Ruminococcus sp.]|nr:hypothetical protein [Ruminococcus sp.]MDY3896252.1 hypothetical protein [Candidatus Fimenecus sp.]
MRKIGFWAEKEPNEEQENKTEQCKTEETAAKKSVVRVYFPARGFACSYYNDKFDLKKGDRVYVDGKLEGLLGFVTEVSYCFKIRLSEYKRVIYRVDTEIRGKLYLLGDFFISFGRNVIPKGKIFPWFICPNAEDDVVCSYDEGIEAEIANTGSPCDELPPDDIIPYFCIDKNTVSAVVDLGKAHPNGMYEVGFTFDGTKASRMTCGCCDIGFCMHESAAVSALRGILTAIEKNEKFAEMYNESGYAALINKNSVLENTLNSNKITCMELL